MLRAKRHLKLEFWSFKGYLYTWLWFGAAGYKTAVRPCRYLCAFPRVMRLQNTSTLHQFNLWHVVSRLGPYLTENLFDAIVCRVVDCSFRIQIYRNVQRTAWYRSSDETNWRYSLNCFRLTEPRWRELMTLISLWGYESWLTAVCFEVLSGPYSYNLQITCWVEAQAVFW